MSAWRLVLGLPGKAIDDARDRPLVRARGGPPPAGRAGVARRDQPGRHRRDGRRRAGDGLEPGRGAALRLLAAGGDRASDRRPRARRGPPRRGPGRHPRGARERSCRPDHSSRAEGRGAGRRADDARAAPGRRRARRLLRDLPRHHRAPARTRARRDAPGRDAGPRQDAEPRGHVRDDPRRAAAGRALRQLLHPGDPGRPPGDRERARPRRPRRDDRSGLRPGRRDQPRYPGRAIEAATGLRRRLAPPALRERGARRRTHPRMALRPDDRRRPRDRRHQRRQVRGRLLRR